MECRYDKDALYSPMNPVDEIAKFHDTTLAKIQEWKAILTNNPYGFFEVEKAVDTFFRKGGGMLSASLLDDTSKAESVKNRIASIQHKADTPMRNPCRKTIVIRLLCGILIYVNTLYCAPKRSTEKKNDTECREESDDSKGIYPELAAYGFAKKSSAALEDEVVHAAALYPSFAIAQRELKRQGLDLNEKEIRRIALQCAEGLLSQRCEKVKLFLENELRSGTALAGKNVVVEMDGGRINQRENIPNPSRNKGSHPNFKADWREPKLWVIYCVDENGKKEKLSQVWIDATLQGVDHAAEMLAATLHELGVTLAKSVTFIADGAPCIWDRFDWVVSVLKLNEAKVPVEFVLDFFHAAHHISLALAEMGFDDATRRTLYKKLRHELRQSQWASVVSQLETMGADIIAAAKAESEKTGETIDCPLLTEINYLRRHGESGHLSYVKFWRRGLPLGSGAVESSIRRVINLRLKSNGMFWTPENAEKMLQLRCQLLSTQWDVRRRELAERRSRTRNVSWRWSAMDRSKAARSGAEAEKPKPTKCRNSAV